MLHVRLHLQQRGRGGPRSRAVVQGSHAKAGHAPQSCTPQQAARTTRVSRDPPRYSPVRGGQGREGARKEQPIPVPAHPRAGPASNACSALCLLPHACPPLWAPGMSAASPLLVPLHARQAEEAASESGRASPTAHLRCSTRLFVRRAHPVCRHLRSLQAPAHVICELLLLGQGEGLGGATWGHAQRGPQLRMPRGQTRHAGQWGCLGATRRRGTQAPSAKHSLRGVPRTVRGRGAAS